MPIDKEALRRETFNRPTHPASQSKSPQQPAENKQVKTIDAAAILEGLRNDAKSAAEGLEKAGKHHVAQNVLRKTEEFTSDVERISSIYQVLLNPEIRELAAVVDAAKKINEQTEKPVSVSVSVGELPSGKLAGFLSPGTLSFSRFYSDQDLSQHQLPAGNNTHSENNSSNETENLQQNSTHTQTENS